MAKDLSPPTPEELAQLDLTLQESPLLTPPSPEEKQAIANYFTPEPPSSISESMLGGAQQGLTLGFADELGGVMGAAMEKGAELIGQNPNESKSITDLYKEYRDLQRARLDKEAKDNPKAALLGNLGGGALGMVGTGLVGGALTGGAKVAQQASTFAQRLRQGAGVGAGIGAVSGLGNSTAPVELPKNISLQGNTLNVNSPMLGDVAEGTATGAALGVGLTPAVEGSVAAAKTTAGALKAMMTKAGSAALPDVPNAFSRGFGKTGRDSREWLVGPEAQQQTSDMIYAAGGEIPVYLENKLNSLATLKKDIINDASQKGVKIDAKKLDEFLSKNLTNEPNSIDPKSNSQILDFQNLIKNAKDGNEVEKVTRVFFGEGNTQQEKFNQLFAQKQMEENLLASPAAQSEKAAFEKLLAQKQAELQAIPGSNPNPLEISYEPIPNEPNSVLGVIKQRVSGDDGAFQYKKVSSRLVNPDDANEMKQVQELLAQKQAEQLAIPGSDPTPLELHLEPTEIQGKQLAVIRQKQTSEGAPDTYRKIASKVIRTNETPVSPPKLEMVLEPTIDPSTGTLIPNKMTGVIRKAIVDDTGKVTGYKAVARKLLSTEDAAAFKDVAEIVRSGDRNISDPKELLQLYKRLKDRTYGETKYSSSEALDLANAARKDVQTLLRDSVDGIQKIDSSIETLNIAKDTIGIPDSAKLPEMNSPEIKQKVGQLILNSTGDTVKAAAERERLQNLITKLKEADPEYGQRFEKRVVDLQERSRTTDAVLEKAYARAPMATPRAWANKTANVLGYGIGHVSPDWIRSAATHFSSNTSQVGKGLSQVLLKAAEADDQGRAAIMFGLMQTAPYRAELERYYKETHEKDK